MYVPCKFSDFFFIDTFIYITLNKSCNYGILAVFSIKQIHLCCEHKEKNDDLVPQSIIFPLGSGNIIPLHTLMRRKYPISHEKQKKFTLMFMIFWAYL